MNSGHNVEQIISDEHHVGGFYCYICASSDSDSDIGFG
jgi:hypothetical protein